MHPPRTGSTVPDLLARLAEATYHMAQLRARADFRLLTGRRRSSMAHDDPATGTRCSKSPGNTGMQLTPPLTASPSHGTPAPSPKTEASVGVGAPADLPQAVETPGTGVVGGGGREKWGGGRGSESQRRAAPRGTKRPSCRRALSPSARARSPPDPPRAPPAASGRPRGRGPPGIAAGDGAAASNASTVPGSRRGVACEPGGARPGGGGGG